MTAKVILKLYVTGETANSQRAIKDLRELLDNELKGVYELLGNIICGTYLATFSNQTGTKIVQHAPQFRFGMLGSILEQTITKFAQRQEEVLNYG